MTDTNETMELDWTLVGERTARYHENVTIIIKFTDGTDLSKLPQDEVGAALLQESSLNNAERKDTYVKIRKMQNVIAVDTYRPTAERKLLAVQSIQLDNKTHPVSSYMASSLADSKGVIHNIRPEISESELKKSLEIPGHQILQVRRLGRSRTILVTIEGAKLPRFALYNRVVMRLFQYRPKSLLCTNCLDIGHKTEVCPRKLLQIFCPTCSQVFPAATGILSPHPCEPHCKNCGGEHPPVDPACPARAAADKLTHENNTHRKQQYITSHGPSRKDYVPKNEDYNTAWPKLPTHNHFALLRDRSSSPHRGQELKGQQDKRCKLPAAAPQRPSVATPSKPNTSKNQQIAKPPHRRTRSLSTTQEKRVSDSVSYLAPHTTRTTKNPTIHPTYKQVLQEPRSNRTTGDVDNALSTGAHNAHSTSTNVTPIMIPDTNPQVGTYIAHFFALTKSQDLLIKQILTQLQVQQTAMMQLSQQILELQRMVKKRSLQGTPAEGIEPPQKHAASLSTPQTPMHDDE